MFTWQLLDRVCRQEERLKVTTVQREKSDVSNGGIKTNISNVN